MKRVLSLFLSCVFVLGVCFSTPVVASAAEGEENGEVIATEFIIGTGNESKFTYEVLTEPGNGATGTCALIKYEDGKTDGGDDITAISVGGPISNPDETANYTVTTIGVGAFAGSKKLTKITIGDSITTIEAGAFSGCSALSEFAISEEALEKDCFSVENGVLFNKVGAKLIAYPAAKADGEGNKIAEYVIPEGVTEIATGAFVGSDVIIVSNNTNITNPDGLVIHNVLAEDGQHTVNYGVSENAIKAKCFCGIDLETIAMMMYDGAFTDTNDKKWAKNATINAASEYTLSLNVEGAYNANLSIETMDNSELSFWAKKGEEVAQKVTVDLGVELDSIAPTGTIELEENSWEKFLNDITFDLFFKGEKTVTIEANDAGSGVKSVEYHIAETNKLLSELETLGENSWTKATLVDGCVSVNLKQNSKNIVYARITDNVGNVTYISSNGIVLYSDSITTTENIEYTKFSNVPVSVNIDLNGNTIKAVKTGDIILTSDTDYTVSLSESDDTATITFSNSMLDSLPVGEQQTLTISYNPLGIESNGVVESDTTITFTINKATPTVTAPTAITGLVYNGGEQELVNAGTANSGDLEYSLDNETWSNNIPEGLEAGEYTVYYRVGITDNYNGVEGSVNVTIAPKTITATIEPIADQIYTGSAIEPTVVVKDGNDILVKDTDYTVEYLNNTEVSTVGNLATVKVTFKGNYNGTATATFEIVEHVHSWTFDVVEDENGNKISATCTDSNCIYHETGEIFSLIINSNENLVYDNNVKNNPVNIDYSANAQNAFGEEFLNKLSVSYSYNGEPCTVKNAGIYTATLVMGEGENSATITKTFEITPKTITATLEEKEFTYDGEEHKQIVKFTDTAESPVEVKLNGEGENADYTVEYKCEETVTPDFTSVGVIQVIVTLKNDNYTFAENNRETTLTYEITPKTVSQISIGDIGAQTYTGSQITPAVVVKDGEDTLTQGTDYTVEYGGNVNAGENAGTVTVVFSDNYEYVGDPEDLTKIFTINKAIPDVEKFEFTAPENLTYDGNEKTATVVVKDGITGMGAITIKYYGANGALLTETPKAEGTYTVKINVAEGTNFVAATEITSGDWKFTIKAHEHDWKYTASGAVITATCQNNGCDIKTTTVELVAPESLAYDGTEKSVTVKAPHADLLSEYTVTNMKATDAGKYTAFIKIGNATASLDFEISKAVIVVTKVTAIDRVYDGNLVVSINKTDGIVYTGLIDDDKVGFDLSALTGTLSDANVGSNKTVKVNGSIVLTGEDAKNYDVSTPGVTNVNITPATLTVTPNAKSSEQYYSLPALDYKVTGFIGSDKLTKEPTLTTNADIKKVGNYTITATGAEASANYVIKYATAPLTITAHKNHIVKDGTWKETVHGTCMVAGKEAGTCTLCSGTVTRDSKTDPNNHALITTVTKLQTCTQNGEALVTCANGCSYSLKTALPADGESHSFAKDFTVIASTCVAKGSKYKVCQNPGCKVVSEKTEIAINPDAHKNIVTVNAKDATCETKGYTGDKVCNDCKKTTDPGMEINAKGHTESDWIIDKEPTFTEEGAKHTACTVCKKALKKEVIAKRALEVPKVKIENVSNGIKVSWSQDEDATGYTVYSSTYNASTKKWSSWKNRGTAAATKSSWTDKTVTEGVTYRYTVRSVNGTNRSSYKATSGLLYVVAPKATVSITSTGLLAKWNKVSNATSYIVYRAELGADGKWGKWVQLGTTQAEKNTWSDTNTQSGVTYRYTVRAVVGKVKSGYTASSSIIYLAQPVLKIENVSNGIQGKWSPIAGATGYTIYRSEYNTSTGKWSKWLTLGTTGATSKTFTDKTVKSGYKYKYTIRAVNGNLKSTYQASNKLVYLAQPTLKISNVANGIQGKWNQVNGATGYIIYRSELIDGKWTKWVTLGTAKATAKTFTDKTVKSGVQYRYTIRAKNGGSKSSYVASNQSVFLSVPTVKISSGITGVNVSWSKIEGATSYLVYRREYGNGKWSKWSEIKTVTETSFVDETAKSGTGYRYTVRALNGSSKSTYTSTKTLNYLAAPTVKLEKLSDSIKVNWTQVTGVKGYTIYRAELGADGKWSKWVTLGTATDKYSSCKDKTAKAGVTYKYTVRAVNGKVKSAYIDGIQITNR